MTLNHNYGCFSGVVFGIAGNVQRACEVALSGFARNKATGAITRHFASTLLWDSSRSGVQNGLVKRWTLWKIRRRKGRKPDSPLSEANFP